MKRYTYNRRGGYGKRHSLTERQHERTLALEPRNDWTRPVHKRNDEWQHMFKRDDQGAVWDHLTRTLGVNLEL